MSKEIAKAQDKFDQAQEGLLHYKPRRRIFSVNYETGGWCFVACVFACVFAFLFYVVSDSEGYSYAYGVIWSFLVTTVFTAGFLVIFAGCSWEFLVMGGVGRWSEVAGLSIDPPPDSLERINYRLTGSDQFFISQVQRLVHESRGFGMSAPTVAVVARYLDQKEHLAFVISNAAVMKNEEEKFAQSPLGAMQEIARQAATLDQGTPQATGKEGSSRRL